MEHRLERATSTTVENVYANAIFPFVRRAPRPCDTVPIFNSINIEIRFDGIEDELGVNASMSPGGLSLFTNRSGIKRSDNDRKFPRRWKGIEGGQGSIVKSMEGTLHTLLERRPRALMGSAAVSPPRLYAFHGGLFFSREKRERERAAAAAAVSHANDIDRQEGGYPPINRAPPPRSPSVCVPFDARRAARRYTLSRGY